MCIICKNWQEVRISAQLLRWMEAGGGDAARNKAAVQTKLPNRSGILKLLLLLGEEIFEHMSHLQELARIEDIRSMIACDESRWLECRAEQSCRPDKVV